MIKKWHVWLTVICLVSGLLMVTLFKTHQSLQAEATTRKNDTLISIIEDLEKETESLEQRIKDLHQLIDEARKKQSSGQGLMADMEQDIKELKMMAGLTEVKGPGVVVVLDDNAKGAEAAKSADILNYNPENFIIHDKNVLYIINDLKNAGAEAISVNNQRIVTTSNIRCVGTVILVNSTRMAPPYEIKAIGDPDKLEEGVLNSQEYMWLSKKDFPVKVTKHEELEIPAYTGNFSPNFAQAVNQGEDNDEQ